MKTLTGLFLVLLVSACNANPTQPSSIQALDIPASLRPAFELLDNDAWQHPLLSMSLGAYVRSQTKNIVIDGSLANGLGALAQYETRTILWNPLNDNTKHDAALLLHEARHLEGYRHSCGEFIGAGDRTMEEGGTFAVQILYLEHLGMIGEAKSLRSQYIGCEVR